jgi:hypothetical protein
MDKGIVEHLIPGRIRLRFRQQRGNEDLFRSLVARLVGHPGVQSVRPNPSTGSLFIFHEGNCAPEWRGKTAARRALTPPNGEYAPARNPRFLGACAIPADPRTRVEQCFPTILVRRRGQNRAPPRPCLRHGGPSCAPALRRARAGTGLNFSDLLPDGGVFCATERANSKDPKFPDPLPTYSIHVPGPHKRRPHIAVLGQKPRPQRSDLHGAGYCGPCRPELRSKDGDPKKGKTQKPTNITTDVMVLMIIETSR